MLIRILAVGQRSPRWVDEAVNEYAKRFGRDIQYALKEIKPEKRGAGVNAAQGMAAEEKRIMESVPEGAYLVVLDERGDDLRTTALAQRLQRWQQAAEPVAILIGGPDGLDASLKACAHERIRLSSLTLPHTLVRVLLAEQLYRAWSINAGHPYHRE